MTACSEGKHQVSLDPSSNMHQVLKAASGPLEDLNLQRDEIPPLLKTVTRDPYAMPEKMQCACIKQELAQLDAVLGKDVEPILFVSDTDDDDPIGPSTHDLPDTPDGATLVNQGVNVAHDRLLDFIHDETNIIPLRSIVRKISGADRHARKVAEAIQAGKLRRAYLKGLARAQFGIRCLPTPGILEVNAAPPPRG